MAGGAGTMKDVVSREIPDAAFTIVPTANFSLHFTWRHHAIIGRTIVCRHFLHRARLGCRTAPLQTLVARPVMAGSDQGCQRCASQKPRAV